MVTLDGINAKFDRAHEQLGVLDGDFDVFIKTQSNLIAEEIEPETGHKIWIFRGENPNPPIEWAVRIGEILYNFRSALDHLIEQLILSNGGSPTNRNAFPIFNCKNQFQGQAKSMISGVNSRVEATIERLQPYHGDDIMKHLWRLHVLHNADKHRHLNMLAEPDLRNMRVRGSDPRFGPLYQQGNFTPTFGPLKKNTIILRSRDPEVEVDVDIPIFIAFADSIPQVTDNLPVQNILHVIRGSVYHSLYTLKPELH